MRCRLYISLARQIKKIQLTISRLSRLAGGRQTNSDSTSSERRNTPRISQSVTLILSDVGIVSTKSSMMFDFRVFGDVIPPRSDETRSSIPLTVSTHKIRVGRDMTRSLMVIVRMTIYRIVPRYPLTIRSGDLEMFVSIS